MFCVCFGVTLVVALHAGNFLDGLGRSYGVMRIEPGKSCTIWSYN